MFLKLILEPIESMEERLEFFALLTDKSVDKIEAKRPQFDDSFGEACIQTKYLEHIERNPHEFSWKRIAEALYIHGNQLFLNDIFCLVKSPEGMYFSCVSHYNVIIKYTFSSLRYLIMLR